MKKSKYILASLLLSTALFTGLQGQVAANDITLQDHYNEEALAYDMYQEMIEKFDNDEYYQRIQMAESKHMGAIERLMNSQGLQVKQDSVQATIPNDELAALQAAYDYEIADIESLTLAIESSQDPQSIRVFENLRRGSQNHADSLARAIESFQAGNTDLSQLRLNDGQGNRGNMNNNSQMGPNNGQGNGNNLNNNQTGPDNGFRPMDRMNRWNQPSRPSSGWNNSSQRNGQNNNGQGMNQSQYNADPSCQDGMMPGMNQRFNRQPRSNRWE